MKDNFIKEAVRFVKEIIRKRKALYGTKSSRLKRDYEKSISRDMDDLLYYVRCHDLDMKKIWDFAFDDNERICEKS